MNKLVIVGWGMGPHAGPNTNRGVKRCYLNITVEEAVRRYTAAGGQAAGKPVYISPILPISVIEFDDWFEVFDVWGATDARDAPALPQSVASDLLRQRARDDDTAR